MLVILRILMFFHTMLINSEFFPFLYWAKSSENNNTIKLLLVFRWLPQYKPLTNTESPSFLSDFMSFFPLWFDWKNNEWKRMWVCGVYFGSLPSDSVEKERLFLIWASVPVVDTLPCLKTSLFSWSNVCIWVF